MKKTTFAILACAALTLGSCGNSTKSNDAAEVVDTTKSFEQQQVEAAIKMHIDSLAAQLNDKEMLSIDENIKAGKLTLSADEKKVQPVYLLAPSAASEMTTAGQKYAALSMLSIDKEVAKAYDQDVEGYDNAIAKLAADLNDPAFKKAEECKTAKEKNDVLYKEMDAEGRINFYWIGTSAATVENLYIMSQNVDKFTEGYTDEQVANITFRLFCIIDALDRLSEYDPQIPGIAESLDPLKDLNATTLKEFKEQMVTFKEKIEASRAAFLQ